MFKIRKDEEIEYDFLPDVLEITEKPTSKAGKLVIYLLFSIIIIAIIWSCIFKVDMVVTGRGQIIPEGNLRVL